MLGHVDLSSTCAFLCLSLSPPRAPSVRLVKEEVDTAVRLVRQVRVRAHVY